jgi:hypothetical protein
MFAVAMLGGGMFICIQREKKRRTWKNGNESALTSVLLRNHTASNQHQDLSNRIDSRDKGAAAPELDVDLRETEFLFNHSLNRGPGLSASSVKRSLSATQQSCRGKGKTPSGGANATGRLQHLSVRTQNNETMTLSRAQQGGSNKEDNFLSSGSSSRYQRQRRRRQQNVLGPRSVLSAEDVPFRMSQGGTSLERRKMISPGGLHRISRISTAPVKRRKRFQDIFELGSVVGRGAMCAVHQCHLRASGETFAVKVFAMHGPEQHSVLQQLAAEISTHRLLSHPNIVSLRACFQEPEAMYVVMEYLAGGDLLDRILNKINSNDPYRERDAAHVMKSIFSALSHLHDEHNMAHRDIKPENILLADVNDDLTVKLADFGTAVRLPGRRRAHSYTGSPQYMAPEVCATLNGCVNLFSNCNHCTDSSLYLSVHRPLLNIYCVNVYCVNIQYMGPIYMGHIHTLHIQNILLWT